MNEIEAMDRLSIPLALLYATMGVLSLALAFTPDWEVTVVGLAYSGDIMLGLVFLVIAGTFAASARALMGERSDHLPFGYVGSLLASIVLLIQVVTVLSELVLELIGGDPWVLAESLHPTALVGVLALAAFIHYRRKMGPEDCALEGV